MNLTSFTILAIISLVQASGSDSDIEISVPKEFTYASFTFATSILIGVIVSLFIKNRKKPLSRDSEGNRQEKVSTSDDSEEEDPEDE